MRTSESIRTTIAIENMLDPSKKIECRAVVDTGSSHVVLPSAWRERLGELEELGIGEFETANREKIAGAICGPVEIRVAGFRPVASEVVFADRVPTNRADEVLLGYIPLEQIPVAVDMLGRRLVPVKYLDLK